MKDEEENLTIDPVVCQAIVQQYSIRQKAFKQWPLPSVPVVSPRGDGV
jgi:hypothetical protein